jgi:hypothetical protein
MLRYLLNLVIVILNCHTGEGRYPVFLWMPFFNGMTAKDVIAKRLSGAVAIFLFFQHETIGTCPLSILF